MLGKSLSEVYSLTAWEINQWREHFLRVPFGDPYTQRLLAENIGLKHAELFKPHKVTPLDTVAPWLVSPEQKAKMQKEAEEQQVQAEIGLFNYVMENKEED